MPEDILVVEYEPRYVERIKQALAGQPLQLAFAKDGEEALRTLDSRKPRLIVLSSVIPKVGTGELIRVIRSRSDLQAVPILITASGYSGKSPKADAMRLGASDILPKPYSESEFLSKVQQALGLSPERTEAFEIPASIPASVAPPAAPDPPPDVTTQLTSREIFGDLVDPSAPTAHKRTVRHSGSVDKMLADTLSGVLPAKKKEGEVRPPAVSSSAPTEIKPKPARPDIDKLLHDSLSGLERGARPRSSESAPHVLRPASVPPPPAPSPGISVDMPASSPIFPASTQAEPEPFGEESATDGQQFGPYVLLEKIATGGMAEVWKARRRGVEGFQKIVAIKKILPHLSDNEEFIEMFVDEAKLAAQLNHNNIIHIYDLGKIGSSYYIAMELIDGHDLKTILKRGEERDQPMQAEIALFVASKIAAALDYAHRKRDFDEKEMGLVHRDVSPQNVLISHEGDIKLCDFGIAKAASKASHTQAGALKGKLQYMSPEQAWGKKIDRRSDIFALGAVLFEMLTARKLFSGDTEVSILDRVRDANVMAPSSINDEIAPEIDNIVLKALKKEPEERYQTAGEMARDLDAVLYDLRPTPSSADLAIYMHRLDAAPMVVRSVGFDDHITQAMPGSAAASAPTLFDTPLPESRLTDAWAAPIPTESPLASSVARPAKSPLIPISIAAVVLIGVGLAYLLTRDGKSPVTPAAAVTSTSVPSAPVPSPGVVNTESVNITETALPASPTPGASPALDQARIDEEVTRRLRAEQDRLAGQRAAQVAADERARQRSAAASVPEQAATSIQPSPLPVSTPAAVADTRPEPPPAPAQAAPAAEVRRVSEGDMVEPGTEGLIPPRLIRLVKPPYPPMAKIQKVEGIVVVSVLVSETGKVLDVKVLRGITMLNQAAVDAVRKSPFTPATKDGVRVRTRATLTIPFTL